MARSAGSNRGSPTTGPLPAAPPAALVPPPVPPVPALPAAPAPPGQAQVPYAEPSALQVCTALHVSPATTQALGSPGSQALSSSSDPHETRPWEKTQIGTPSVRTESRPRDAPEREKARLDRGRRVSIDGTYCRSTLLPARPICARVAGRGPCPHKHPSKHDFRAAIPRYAEALSGLAWRVSRCRVHQTAATHTASCADCGSMPRRASRVIASAR